MAQVNLIRNNSGLPFGNPEREDLTPRLWIEAIEEEPALDSPT